MATIKAGTYRFNDELSFEEVNIEQNINGYMTVTPFDGNTYTAYFSGLDIGGYARYLDIVFDYLLPELPPIFGISQGDFVTTYHYVEGGWFTNHYGEGIQTITITEDTEVSEEFAEWFNANAVSLDADKPLTTITYNGETIATLDGGQKAVLKCKGDNVKMLSDIEVEVAEVEQGGGGASLNIAYGDTEPTDTSKLWVKADEPSKVSVGVMEGGTEELRVVDSASLSNSASGVGVASVGNKIYSFGGYGNNTFYNLIQVFDTETNSIETLSTTLPEASNEIGVASVGTKIYLFGGKKSGARLRTINVFDTESGTIETLATTLPVAAYAIGTASVGTKIYLFGGAKGTSSSDILNTVYVFDTETNTISNPSTISKASGIGVASVGTKIYLFGGKSGNTYRNSITEYDTVTGIQTVLSTTLRIPSTDIGVASVGTKIYLFGGTAINEYPDELQVFDTQTNSVETLSSTLLATMTNIGVASVGTKIYLFGGQAGETSLYYSTIHEFIVALSLANGTMQIATNGDNLWKMLNTDTVTAEIGVKDVYIGNADGVAEKVPSALYKDGAWVEI